MKKKLLLTLLVFVSLSSISRGQIWQGIERILWDAADKANWSVYASNEHDLSDGGLGGPATFILDGRSDTYWHSVWGADVLPGVTLDIHFNHTKEVKSIILQQRKQQNRQIEDFRLYFKTNLDDSWGDPILEESLSSSTAPQKLDFGKKYSGRYMRIEILSKTDGTTSNVCLAQVGIGIVESYNEEEYTTLQDFLMIPVDDLTIDRITNSTRKYWEATELTSVTPYINISEDLIEFCNDLSITQLLIDTNVDSWQYQCNASWIDIVDLRDNDVNGLEITVSEYKELNMRSDTIFFEAAGEIVKMPIIQQGVQLSPDFIPEDTYVTPSQATSTTSYTQNHTADNLINRNTTGGNNYHSAVNHSSEVVKESLEFTFPQPSDKIDYLVYHSAGAGNFHDISIFVETEESQGYKHIGDYNWGEAGGTKKFQFPESQHDVTRIKLELDVSPNGGFIAAREIEFCSATDDFPLNEPLLKVFTDLSCSKLRTDYTSEDVDKLPQFFQIIAEKIESENYETDYRINSYEPYSNPDYFASVLNTNAYNPFDNPTGIYANEGDIVYVMVQDISHDISLMSVSAGSVNRSSYSLNPGINRIKIERTGLLYVSYIADLTTNPDPVTIHIVEGGGIINGYWDIEKKSGNEWSEILNNASHEVIDIIGDKFMGIFHVEPLRENLAYCDDISNSVKIWDALVESQWNIIGLNKYPRPRNNRMLGISFEGSGHMWATWYTTGYNVYTLTGEVLYPGIVNGDNIWGMGHEHGHCNQHSINWPSMTEVSVNFFSQLALEEVINSYREITDDNRHLESSQMSNPVV
ncbi:M60 family metallopeptidase, partial [Marinilabiliaceae bacterium ANBcel2]|nr:M60 family metallopeptidase [Marinilabiliaceae bacterium ANBcel2]